MLGDFIEDKRKGKFTGKTNNCLFFSAQMDGDVMKDCSVMLDHDHFYFGQAYFSGDGDIYKDGSGITYIPS